MFEKDNTFTPIDGVLNNKDMIHTSGSIANWKSNKIKNIKKLLLVDVHPFISLDSSTPITKNI